MADEQQTDDPKDETDTAAREESELTDETLDKVSGGWGPHFE